MMCTEKSKGMTTSMNGRARGRMWWIGIGMYITPVVAGVVIGSLGSISLGALALGFMCLELYLCRAHELTLWMAFTNLWSSFTDTVDEVDDEF